MDVNSLIEEVENKIDTLAILRKSSKEDMASCEKEITNLEKDIESTKEAIQLCQACLEDQLDTRADFEVMINEAIKRVFFEYDMEYSMEPVYKADGVTLSGIRQVVTEYGTTQDIKKAHGFGMVDVNSMIWNIIFLKMIPGLTPTIVWDENLSRTNFARLPAVLDFINEIGDFQYVFITNNKVDDEYITHFFKKEGKKTQVEHL